MNIESIADIHTGYAFKNSVEENLQGEMLVLQAKDINKSPVSIDDDVLTKISSPSTKARFNFVKNGDVLLIARGLKAGNFKSAVFNSNSTKTIASSSVLIIRVNNQNILKPEFLCFYLNSPLGQISLANSVTGSYIGSITKSNLIKNLNIPIKTIQEQEKIVQLHKNLLEQLKLDRKRVEIKERIINSLITN